MRRSVDPGPGLRSVQMQVGAGVTRLGDDRERKWEGRGGEWDEESKGTWENRERDREIETYREREQGT